uniref:Uncharacterized protein n=1 Tax=Oryza brachyantha TaxID=4533 RepID=J3MRX2_ORYBR
MSFSIYHNIKSLSHSSGIQLCKLVLSIFIAEKALYCWLICVARQLLHPSIVPPSYSLPNNFTVFLFPGGLLVFCLLPPLVGKQT